MKGRSYTISKMLIFRKHQPMVFRFDRFISNDSIGNLPIKKLQTIKLLRRKPRGIWSDETSAPLLFKLLMPTAVLPVYQAFQRSRLSPPLFDACRCPSPALTHYIVASGKIWALETETTTFGNVFSPHMCKKGSNTANYGN